MCVLLAVFVVVGTTCCVFLLSLAIIIFEAYNDCQMRHSSRVEDALINQ